MLQNLIARIISVIYRCLEEIKVFFGIGIDVISLDEQLLQAVKDGNVEEVKSLLDRGADVDAQHSGDPSNEQGCTALYYASCSGSKEIVELLLQRGADPNIQSRRGRNTLSNTIKNNSQDIAQAIVQLLIKYGADVTIDQKILHIAAHYANAETVELLIEAGANINFYSRFGYGGIYEGTPLYISTKYENVKVIELLLNRGADVNAKDFGGDGPLHCATKSNNVEIIKLLLNRGADVNAKGTYGCTPLHWAVGSKNPEFIRLFLQQKKIDVNAKDNGGMTPLHDAAKAGYTEVFFLLLLYGADISKESQCVREKINNTPRLKNYCLEAFEEIKAMPHLGKLIEANASKGKQKIAKVIAEYINNETDQKKLIEEFKNVKGKYGSHEQLSFIPEYLLSFVEYITLTFLKLHPDKANAFLTKLKEACEEPNASLTGANVEQETSVLYLAQ